jgi:hypothetical protein
MTTADAGDAATAARDAALPLDASASAKDAGLREAEAATPVASEAGVVRDGAIAQSGCMKHADCMLVAKSCCACEKTLENVVALPLGANASVPCPGLCGGCAPLPYDPLNAWVAPACVQGQCAAQDLRKAEETRCTRDDDCEAVPESQRCCTTCSSDPKFYRAKRKGSTVTVDGAPCAGDVACPACIPTLPTAYCAPDGHCAVR